MGVGVRTGHRTHCCPPSSPPGRPTPLTSAVSPARPVGSTSPRARPCSLGSAFFPAGWSFAEGCGALAGLLVEGDAAACSILPEGSHQTGPCCPGNHQRNIPLPGWGGGGRPGGEREGTAGKGAASALSGGGFNSQSKLGCSGEDTGPFSQESTPLVAPCLVKPLPGWVGWGLTQVLVCSGVHSEENYWVPTVCQVLAGAKTWQYAEGLPCSSPLRVHSLCWGWGYPGHVSRSPRPD